jgi:hypothetical protein
MLRKVPTRPPHLMVWSRFCNRLVGFIVLFIASIPLAHAQGATTFLIAKEGTKKPEYVLVQYLRNNKRIDFRLCKVISGNVIVIDNKGHELNPKYLWLHKKYVWYIVREKDTKPVSVTDRITGWGTDDHQILMKMTLGAVQKKELAEGQKKAAGLIIGLIILAVVGWIIFGG